MNSLRKITWKIFQKVLQCKIKSTIIGNVKNLQIKKQKTKTKTQEHTHTIIKKKRKTLKKKTTLNFFKKTKNY